jgi:5'-nucleotidase
MTNKSSLPLVIGVSSSALFDLEESGKVFKEKGKAAYNKYQEENENNHLEKGVAFPFIKNLLDVNKKITTALDVNKKITAASDKAPDLIKVVLLSKNDANTGLRILNSIEKEGLDITTAAFVAGESPYKYFNVDLFLSADKECVIASLNEGIPAGQVIEPEENKHETSRADEDKMLRIAFDYDGVIADRESEEVFQKEGVAGFEKNEIKKSNKGHLPGPLHNILKKISFIQKKEQEIKEKNDNYQTSIRTAIVTARGIKTAKRAINTIRNREGVTIDETFYLSGNEKTSVLKIFKPDIFFDDHHKHTEDSKNYVPSVHIPYVE